MSGLLCMLYGILGTAQNTGVISQVTKVTTDWEEFALPRWSPSGDKLMFTATHDNAGIYVYDLDSKKINKVSDTPRIGYNAVWSSDTTIDFQEKKWSSDNTSFYEKKQIDIATKKVKATGSISKTQIMSASSFQKGAKRISEISAYINGELQLVILENGEERQLTDGNGQYYQPMLSPDQTKIVVHEGPNIWVIDLYGQRKLQRIGEGLASSWTPDSKAVLTFQDESEDGHTVSGSELYQIDVATGKQAQLTTSDTIAETWPSLSPDGTRIAFSDEKTGSIYIADFKN